MVVASTPPVQDRKKKRVISSSDDEDTIDVEDVQRERAYAQAGGADETSPGAPCEKG